MNRTSNPLVATAATVLLAAAAILLAAGCDRIPGLQASPSEVVEKFLWACNQGKYSEAETYYSAPLRSVMKGPVGQMMGGITGECGRVTKNGNLAKIEALSESVSGERATVTFTLVFKDGSTVTNTKSKDAPLMVIREEGAWRITVGGL